MSLRDFSPAEAKEFMEKAIWHICNISSEEEFVEFLKTKGASFLSILSFLRLGERKEESLLRLIVNRLHYSFFQFFRWFIWQEGWRRKIEISDPPKYTGVKHAAVKELVMEHLPSSYRRGEWSRAESLIKELVIEIYDHREHAVI